MTGDWSQSRQMYPYIYPYKPCGAFYDRLCAGTVYFQFKGSLVNFTSSFTEILILNTISVDSDQNLRFAASVLCIDS